MTDHSAEWRTLLNAATPLERDVAWQHFVGAYSRLFLHVAHSVFTDRDAMMDAYAHVLDELRAHDFARLRGFAEDGRGKLSTWLVVVVRRLCLDHYRARYGRARSGQSETASTDHALRRRLQHLTGEAVELSELPATSDGADIRLSAAELLEALATALDGLAPSDRLLLALRFDDELSALQIARVLHFPTPFHVYRRLEAVTRILRAALQARGVEGAAP